MTASDLPGRDDLAAWRESRATHVVDPSALTAWLRLRLGARFDDAWQRRLDAFADSVTRIIEPAVSVVEAQRDYPRLSSYDEIGRHVERIEFHPAHHDATRAAWEGALTATPLNEVGAFELAGLFFLLSHVAEGGVACPLVCTIGLRRAIERRGSDELRERYLAGLRETDASRALRGSQFLTELQGGSDVGANVTRAEPDPETAGAWRLRGEKWFCSVADADLFAVTARTPEGPTGTRGLGCFLVPRTLDGVTPNGFRIRRLKDKLGTRAMASGEIDFDGALGWPLGPLEEGFDVAVSELLNTSRWLNALGSTGIMNRAYQEASTYAHHRRAFARPIESFDAVRAQLAAMKIEVLAALASTMALTELVGKVDEGTASPRDVAVHRFLVNANKYVTSRAATDVVRHAMEILGGNGTIEDFSCLPRLYRDAVVYESWEGTHNVLCAQVRRDCERFGLLDHVDAWLREELELISSQRGDESSCILRVLDRLVPSMKRSIDESATSNAGFRHQLGDLMRAVQGTGLLTMADSDVSSARDLATLRAFLDLSFEDARLDTAPRWLTYVNDILALPLNVV